MPRKPARPAKSFVYRRVHPAQFNSKLGLPKPQAFALRDHEDGLSVFHGDIAPPRGALQAFIDLATADLTAEDEVIRSRARKRLEQFPTVEAMVDRGWRIVRIPISEIRDRGFQLSDPEPDGHVQLVGERDRFRRYELDFVQLVKDGIATILTSAECLD